MRIANLVLAKYQLELNPAQMWLQATFVAAMLLAIYGTLPHAFSQESNATDADGQASDKTVASAASAIKRGNAFIKPYGYYLNPILEHIKASKDQRVRITAIVQSFRERIQPLTSEYKEKNHEFLNDVAHCEHPEVIMDEQTHLGRLYSDITLYYCQMSLEVRRVLSPEQIVRYEEFKRRQGWTHSTQSQAN